MATKKQIEANRLNSRKSSVPRTPQGKARSSMNALSSGIDAETQLIPGELPAHLNNLRDEYYDRYQPVTPAQRMFVDTLIDSEWLLRRLRKVEASIWSGYSTGGAPMDAEQVARCYRDFADQFSRLQRRIDSTQRNFRNALHELERLQASESPERASDTEPVTPQPATANPENGFVPKIIVQPEQPKPATTPGTAG